MVCRKCGKSFDNNNTCPFCGVGQENQINIKRLENELERLKIGEDSSNFNDVQNKPLIDVEDIIDRLESLKIKDEEENNEIVPRVEPVSDEELIELIDDIKENKDLFIVDKSQYQYVPKKVEEPELIDIDEDIDIIDVEEPKSNNIGISDLYKKQRIYYPEAINIEKKEEKVELPHVVENEIFKTNTNNKQNNYKKELVICMIVLAVVIITMIFFVYKFMFSPKAKFIKNISSSYTEIQNIIDRYTKDYTSLLSNNNISVNSIITIKTTENDKSNSEVLNLKYIEDKKDKSQYYEYTNFNSIKTIYNKSLIKDNKLYINKENQTNEFYRTDARFISILNNSNLSNIKYMVNLLIDSIKNNIDNSNFRTKTVKEDNKKLKEYSLELSEKKFNEIYSSYLINIKKDKEAINILKSSLDFSSVELITNIDKILKELETKTSDEVILTYKFYTIDKSIVRHQVSYDDYEITLTNDAKKKELYINKSGERLLYLELKNKDVKTNRYSIVLNYNDYELVGDYYEEDKKVILNYQKKYKNNNNEIVNLVLTKGNIEDKKYTNNISIAYQNTDNNNVVSKNITVTNILETGTKIPQLNVDSTSSLMNDNLINKLKEKFSIFIK